MSRKIAYNYCRRGVCVCTTLAQSYGEIVRFDIGIEMISRLSGRHPKCVLIRPTGADKSLRRHPAVRTSRTK